MHIKSPVAESFHVSAYQLDRTSHLNPHLNRVLLQAVFKLGRKYGLTQEEHISLMRSKKEGIRRRDAEPAAWFFGPSRELWVSARMERGELTSHEEIGRALEGSEYRAEAAA